MDPCLWFCTHLMMSVLPDRSHFSGLCRSTVACDPLRLGLCVLVLNWGSVSCISHCSLMYLFFKHEINLIKDTETPTFQQAGMSSWLHRSPIAPSRWRTGFYLPQACMSTGTVPTVQVLEPSLTGNATMYGNTNGATLIHKQHLGLSAALRRRRHETKTLCSLEGFSFVI